MNSIERFKNIIDIIEDNLTNDIDINAIARQAGMSLYEFRRIFTFIAGIPLGEYIRKRRLSCAAEELLTTQDSITTIAFRYGYESSAAFSRSFKAFHGISPTEVVQGHSINMYTPIDFTFSAQGGKDIPYRILEDTEFWIVGISGLSDADDTECCEKIWNAFYENETLQSSLVCPDDKIYAIYKDTPCGVSCIIGSRAEKPSETFDCIYVPSRKWACFKLNSTEDKTVNAFYEDIVFRWRSSGKYKYRQDFENLEVFPCDMDSEGFPWEIRIPLL